MTSSEIFQIIIGLSAFACAVAIIPALLQARRTLKKAEVFMDSLNSHVDPLCKSITNAADELQKMSVSIKDKAEKTDAIIDIAMHSVNTLHSTSNMLKGTVTPFITHVGGISAGLATFAHFFNRSRNKSKGDR